MMDRVREEFEGKVGVHRLAALGFVGVYITVIRMGQVILNLEGVVVKATVVVHNYFSKVNALRHMLIHKGYEIHRNFF